MAFQQLIAGKVKLNGIGGIRRHLQERERVKTNPNIDLSRSHLNYCLEDLTPDHLISRVNSRIKQLNLKKRPRSDAVGLEDIIIGASTDFMLKLGVDKRNQYFSDALHFFQNRYGKENVMYCQCHLDESNPHIHIGIIPITPDGRLSAKSLFSPKTLEQLQTDFHNSVSSNYGLERGEHHEHHSKKYLPLLQFKATQAKKKAAIFVDDLNTAVLNQQKIDQINKTAHYATSGIIFISKDKENVELATSDFLLLRHLAENGVKAVSKINVLNDTIQQLRRDEYLARSDLKYYLHELKKLEKNTAKYSSIPSFWRHHIDNSIDYWQKVFTDYCHDVNRAIVRFFIATNGDFNKTSSIMKNLISDTGITDFENHIAAVIRSAKSQFSHNSQPQRLPPSWNIPKPADTDYNQKDFSDLVSLQLSNVPDINWDMINWNLLSELDKDEIRHKQIFRSL